MNSGNQINPSTGGRRNFAVHTSDVRTAGGLGVLDKSGKRKAESGIIRPHYSVMTPARALDWDWRNYDLTEKMDGVWHELHIGRSVVIGELMKDGAFFAFELPIFDGRDMRYRPRFERMEILDRFRLRRPRSPKCKSQFIRTVLDAGGEGIVAAPRDGFFGVDIIKIKRFDTYDCRVLEKHAVKLSLHLDFEGADAGWCACLTQAVFDAIQPGDVVGIRAYGRTMNGKFREPRMEKQKVESRNQKIISV